MSPGGNTAVVESIDPANGELFETYEVFSPAQIENALGGAHACFDQWRKSGWEQRSEVMSGVARELRAASDELADIVSREMGKPITEALAEVEKCAWAADHYAETRRGASSPRNRSTARDERRVVVHKRPLGVVLAIMPWNYPLWQVMRAAAPIVSAGNCLLLEARLQRDRLRPRAGARLRARRGARGPLQDRDRPRLEDQRPDRRPADRRRDPDRLRRRRRRRRRSGRARDQAGRARARRLRPVHRPRRRRSRQGGRGGGHRPLPEHRPELHRIEALHRRRGGRRRVRSGASPRRPRSSAAAPRSTPTPSSARWPARTCATSSPGSSSSRSRPAPASSPAAAAPQETGAWYEPTVLSAEAGSDAPVLSEETFGPVAAVARVADEAAAIALANDSQFGLGSQPLDDRPRARRGAQRRDRSGDGLRQRDDRLGPADALRRREAERRRPRARRRIRDAGLPQPAGGRDAGELSGAEVGG